ncbi:MAG: metal ABC transporter ATP-binding protein [Prevotella sp.]
MDTTQVNTTPPLLRLSGISAGYGRQTVLHHVSLQVAPHDYLGIIGPNGGGKTTLVRVILGLLKPSAGTIAYYRDGQETTSLAMGYLPQYSHIDHHFPISVRQVVRSGLATRRQLLHPHTAGQQRRVDDTLQRMQIAHLAGRPIGTLSGGQLQRVLLARAIVSQPQLLILDEPNTYIDKRFEHQMYDMLDTLNRQCAIILVSHDIASVLHRARRIACVNHTLHEHPIGDIPAEQLERHFLDI